MAPPNTLLLFVPFLFFDFSSCMTFTTDAAPKLVNEVCHRTQNYDFCVRTLTSHPGANNIATPTGLARLSLVLTSRAIYDNDDFIYQSLKTVTNPGVKQVLQHCKINYGASVAAIELAFHNLDAGQYSQLDGNVGISRQNSNDCDRVVKQGPPPPGLQDRNKNALQLTDISIVIANLLLNSS